jgi:hypothetical protein
VKLLVGLWGVSEERDVLTKRLVSGGADEVAWTLSQARDRIVALVEASTPYTDPAAPAADAGPQRPTVGSQLAETSGVTVAK